jgi:dienelactone hydrolase
MDEQRLGEDPMDLGTSRADRAGASRSRSRWVTAVTVALVVTVAVTMPTTPGGGPAGAQEAPPLDCAGWLGDPASGTPEWEQADLNNRQCAAEGSRISQANQAASAAWIGNFAAGQWLFGGDPFRAPHRWKDRRGSYELTSYTDRDGFTWPAALFGPRDRTGGPYPGVVLACHACFPFPFTTENIAIWYWAAQALAEAGYVVFYPMIGGNSTTRTVDATNWFTATSTTPTARGQHNPWHASVDRSRLGLVGHSGAAGVALNVGHTDPRFDAVVAWDPAPIGGLQGITPRTPTMVQVADYSGLGAAPEARPEKPTPAPGSKYTFVDTISAAGVDAMQIAPRASTHLDWTRHTGLGLPHSVYGEMVATYYTLAWLDRYLTPSRAGIPREAMAGDALRRLTANGTQPFDRSADVYSIGTGFYDAARAETAGNAEAGNVPITLAGIPIRNLLSFHYGSRYSLEGGAQRCDDMRAGCPQPR